MYMYMYAGMDTGMYASTCAYVYVLGMLNEIRKIGFRF